MRRSPPGDGHFIVFFHAALHYANIRAALEEAGNTIGPLDLLIAAQARSLGASLVTANAGEFKRVKGLKVQSWK
jgi:tRNA(fMet)-specific endonuclease VapC